MSSIPVHLILILISLLAAACGSGGRGGADSWRPADAAGEARSDISSPRDAAFRIDEKDLVRHVDPMIGTLGPGNVIPGALVPHGMVRLSPATREEQGSIDAYEHERDRIDGFSHTHLEGPGGSVNGYSQILFTPSVGVVKTTPEDYASSFSHDTEEASPGYYAVTLEDHGIRAEVTAAPRAGYHRYTFPAAERANVLIDLGYCRGDTRGGAVEILDERTVRGHGYYTLHPLIEMLFPAGETSTSLLAVYFHAEFDRPFEEYGTWTAAGPVTGSGTESGPGIGAWVTFETSADQVVRAKVGISFIDAQQARRNLEVDIGERSFDQVGEDASAAWNTLLNRVQVEGGADEELTAFYTALYHSLFQPADSTEADGLFHQAADGIGGTYEAEGWRYFTDDWCMWDTFRTSHPLGTIVEPEIRADVVRSLLHWYEVGGWLPKCTWHATGYSRVMIGNPAVPIIADALSKGLDDFDHELAWQAVRKAGTEDTPLGAFQGVCGYPNLGTLPEYVEQGWVSHECDTSQSVSLTLEYAHDDWCTARIADALGHSDDAALFMERSGSWKNHWNPAVGFMQGRHEDGSWVEPFDPADTEGLNNDFCEASSWIYTWFVPHDVQGLVSAMGGAEEFMAKLDAYFDGGHHDPTNQPGFHTPFLYNFAGAPGKAGQRVRALMAEEFGTGPGGLPGNDDAGAMSAWYVLAAMGLYPVCPGDPAYQLVPPLFERTTIHLHPAFYPGGTFTIERAGAGDRIAAASLNGEPLDRTWITHDEVAGGGTLSLTLEEAAP